MKPSSRRTLAMATLSLDDGIRTDSWRAATPLRMRVSMSAIGSLMVMASPPLPTRLRHARDLAFERQPAEADATQRKLTHVAARPSAQLAAVALSHRVLRRPVRLDDHRYFRHGLVPVLS